MDDKDHFDFALVVDVIPQSEEARWEEAVRAASPEAGMRVTVRRPTVIVFAVEDVHELMAIEKAVQWLQGIAAGMTPPVEIKTNPQPTGEV
jgi:hypothetical protein